VNRRIDQKLRMAAASAVIDRHEFCPFHPEATVELYRQDSDLRKPKPGMILAAAEKLALDLPRSWVIGDAPRDIEAGKAAGCRAILLKPPGVAESPAAAAGMIAEPDAIVSSLKEAMDVIAAAVARGNGAAGATDRPDGAEDRTAAAAFDKTRPKPQSASAAVSQQESPGSSSRIEQLAEMILVEMRNRNAHQHDFSVSRLLAGISQVIALAMVFLSYLYREEAGQAYHMMLFAIYLQVLTVSLVVMGRQR